MRTVRGGGEGRVRVRVVGVVRVRVTAGHRWILCRLMTGGGTIIVPLVIRGEVGDGDFCLVFKV